MSTLPDSKRNLQCTIRPPPLQMNTEFVEGHDLGEFNDEESTIPVQRLSAQVHHPYDIHLSLRSSRASPFLPNDISYDLLIYNYCY